MLAGLLKGECAFSVVFYTITERLLVCILNIEKVSEKQSAHCPPLPPITKGDSLSVDLDIVSRMQMASLLSPLADQQLP